MKKSNLIYLWDDYYIEGFALFLLILGCFHPGMFFVLIIYLYWQRRSIKPFIFLCAAMLLLLRFYIFEDQEVPTHLFGSVTVVDVTPKTYTDQITIKYQNMKFNAYVSSNTYQLGDVVFIDANVHEYREQTIPFGFNQKSYYLANNIKGYLDINHIEYVSHKFHIYQLRESLEQYISNFSSQVYMKAFILGERSFDNEQNDLYRNLGILYLFTISGLHIYGLMILIKKIFFYLSLSDQTQTILTLIIFAIFLYINAFSMSVVRIFIIYLFEVITKYKKIDLTHLDSIHIAFFFMLLINIYWIYHLGFLITFLILNFLNLMNFRFGSYQGYIKRLMILGIVIYVVLPFSLVISPFFFILLPGIVFILTSPFFLMSLLILFIPEFDLIFVKVIQFFEYFMQMIEHKNLTFHLPALPFYGVVLYFVFLIFLFRSTSWKIFLKRNLLIVFIFSVFIVDFKLIDKINFYMIDVGQGDSMLIESSDCTIVIDSYQQVLPFIQNLGIYHLDYLILTHSDNDHIQEAQDIIDQIDISHVVINPYNTYPITSNQMLTAKAGDHVSCGNLNIKFLGPIRKYDGANNNSLVFQIEMGSKIFLFTGDIEEKAELDLIDKYGDSLKSDVLKVAHHGSITSSSSDFIHFVNPDIALISVGANNRFGFPDSAVTSELNRKRIITYRTDNQGTILYSFYRKKEKWVLYLPI